MNSKKKDANDSSSSSDATGSSSNDSTTSASDSSSDTSGSDRSGRGDKRKGDRKKIANVPESSRGRKKNEQIKEDRKPRLKHSYSRSRSISRSRSRSRSRSGSSTKLTSGVKKRVVEGQRKRSRSKSTNRLRQLIAKEDKIDSEDFSPLKKAHQFEVVTESHEKQINLTWKDSPRLSAKHSSASPEPRPKRMRSTSSERQLACSKGKPQSPEPPQISGSQDEEFLKGTPNDSEQDNGDNKELKSRDNDIILRESTNMSQSPSQLHPGNARSSIPDKIVHSLRERPYITNHLGSWGWEKPTLL